MRNYPAFGAEVPIVTGPGSVLPACNMKTGAVLRAVNDVTATAASADGCRITNVRDKLYLLVNNSATSGVAKIFITLTGHTTTIGGDLTAAPIEIVLTAGMNLVGPFSSNCEDSNGAVHFTFSAVGGDAALGKITIVPFRIQ